MAGFNKLHWIVLSVILLFGLATVAYASSSFTPDQIFSDPADVGNGGCIGVNTPQGAAIGWNGWDIDEVALAYDRSTDTLHVGISMWNGVIAGDPDNNGNPGTADACLGGSDFPNLGGPAPAGEAIDFIIDANNDGTSPFIADYIAGVSHSVDTSGFVVANYTGDQPPSSYPGDGYGTAAGTGSVTNNPAAGAPDFEFTINSFSNLLGKTPDDTLTFCFLARAGSFVDGTVGEDIAPNVDCYPVTYGLCSISGLVWEDLNNNGVYEPNPPYNEPGLAGAKVELYLNPDNSTGFSVDETFLAQVYPTDNTGVFKFTNLASGTYLLRETDPLTYSSTGDTDGPNDNFIRVTLDCLPAGGQDAGGNDFGDNRVPTAVGLASFNVFTRGGGVPVALPLALAGVTLIAVGGLRMRRRES